MKRNRRRIGRWNDLATRQIVYETDNGIEIDEVDHFELQRKRVFFEDVLLVTKHHYTGVGFVVTTLLIGIAFVAIGLLTRESVAIGIFTAFAAPFLLAAIVRVALGVEVVTVFGKRSRARMRFTFRKAAANRVYAEITAKARDAQRRLEAELRAAEPPPPAAPPQDDVPMPPGGGIDTPLA
jgi:hypothetical protein